MPRAKKEIEQIQPVVEDKKPAAKKQTAKIAVKLSVPVFSLSGKEEGALDLPKEVFGAKVNKVLLAQAVRVYTTNSKDFTGSTKTRGQVAGSTVKLFRQKGTGRARHGSIKAPIFVGGGTVFGPQSRKVRLDLPKKMKKAALISAFSSKALENQVIALANLEKATGKTKEMANLIQKVSGDQKKMASTLIVTDKLQDSVVRAVRNLPKVEVLPLHLINAYEVVKHQVLAMTKEAVESLSKGKGESVKGEEKKEISKTAKGEKGTK